MLLAVALAVRAPRLGHVYVDLATIADTATVESELPVDLASLPWPDAEGWPGLVGASVLSAVGEEPGSEPRPLRLVGTHLYLDRYWREERKLAADLLALGAGREDASVIADGAAVAERVGAEIDGVDEPALAEGLARLFPGDEALGDQARAAATAVRHRLTVVAGGPGTGKTTTVAQVVALLVEQAAALGRPEPLVALAAPTGKAAARLEEALHASTARLPLAPETAAALLELRASTLHRLLGWRPDSHSRFRHHRGNRLPHDVVIVDESSMVSLSLMGRLVEAVRPDARLVLVGDPDQLTSIEAGAVLGDIVGREEREILPGVVVLERPYRYSERGPIDTLARAVRDGDADAALSVLHDAAAHAEPAVGWLEIDAAVAPAAALDPVRQAAITAGEAVLVAARAGDASGALRALVSFRLLCAHRRGPYGAEYWRIAIERWLTDALPDFDPRGPWYLGRPLLVTENDHALGLYNGDTGVVVAGGAGGEVHAAFERRGEPVAFSPSRLRAIDTVSAMTVHKSQGSQFATAVVLLPGEDSPLLTRELLYTAVTRASERLLVVGTEGALRRAIARPAARASGLGERLASG